MNSVFTYFFIIGAAQGFLLTFLLIRKKENIIANRLLAATTLFFGVDLILEALAVTEYIKNIPLLIGLMQAFPYLYGPAIYLYVRFITMGIKTFDYKNLLHYLPFLLIQIYGLFFFYFESPEYQINLVYVYTQLPWHVLLISYLTPLYGGFYIAFAIYEAYKFNKLLKNNFSSIDKYNFSWIKFISIGAVLLWITAMTMTTLQLFYDNEIRPELISYLAISIFVYAMAYKGLRQPEVIAVEKIEEEQKKETSYKKSGLTDKEASKQLKQLLKIMDEEKPYINERLNLDDLSKISDITKHNLSEIINTKIELNFYDFINSYRVEAVKKLIKADTKSRYSILAHGFDAGFSSKSAFYTAFKKFTNLTPAQYRKDMLTEQS